MIRVAVIGCGAMGQRHAHMLASKRGVELAGVLDCDRGRAHDTAQRVGAPVLQTVSSRIDAAVIATPTVTHAEVALPLLKRGLWCLVEKPLAHDAATAKQLLHPRCVVGHCERYNPAVRAARGWRPNQLRVRRTAPPTSRCSDVDVVLDLMIHDLDLLLHWSRQGSRIRRVRARTRRRNDAVRARIETTCGMRADLFASRVAVRPQRRVHLTAAGRRLVLDLLTGRARRSGVSLTLPDERDALTAQWDAFAAAVCGSPSDALVRAGDGIRAIELAERVREVTAQA